MSQPKNNRDLVILNNAFLIIKSLFFIFKIKSKSNSFLNSV
jgi:hypothetical protein